MMYFQDMISTLQRFWSERGCSILQPYDMEVGAGTSHPATALRCLDLGEWNVAYVQPCRRPSDGRYGENPNRMQHFHQFQVILKPSPDDVQDLALQSLGAIGINLRGHDIRFVEDDWANPTLGASGLGWEIWCDGMEVLQFTYMQQIGGMECSPIPAELAYGLERLAMYIQGIDNVWELLWNDKGLTYADVFLKSEKQYCAYNFKAADTELLHTSFSNAILESEQLAHSGLAQPAYDMFIKAAHFFNLLESRRTLSVTNRASYMAKLRHIAKLSCQAWVKGSGRDIARTF